MPAIPFFGILIDEQIGLPFFFVIAGLATGLSPCLFPVLPLTLISIFKTETSRTKSLAIVLMVILGMLTTFTVFTMIAVYISSFLITNHQALNQLFGILIIIFGLVILIPKLNEIFSTFSSKLSPQLTETESSGYLSLFFLGIIYTFIAIPCSGSVFLSVSTVLITVNNPLITMFGLLLFGAGLLLPYAILALASSELRNVIARKMIERQHLLERAVGLFLVIYGIIFLIGTL
ncbi:MAG: cytochrome c biogenesis CcdA family protein [Candidatus Hodarchaeales archaeon]